MLQLLLVDDEMSVVETLAATIAWETIGIGTVHKAFSAKEALDVLNMHDIDIVITDVRMPDMSGLELAAHIRLHWKRTKCLLLTAHADFEYAQSAIQSDICDYVLKPVASGDLLERVSAVVRKIRDEKENHEAYLRAIRTMRDHLPKLKGELLYELIQGKRVPTERLADKLQSLEVPARLGGDIAVALVRFKESFAADYDPFEMSLMEYAIANMAEETFEETFHVWSCKDHHDYLVLVLIPRQEPEGGGERAYASHVRRMGNQLQMNVQHFLKLKVSVLIGAWGRFPDDVTRLYDNLLLIFSRRFGSGKELPVYIAEASEMSSIGTLHCLYEPPLLIHLMEAGDWEAAVDKLEAIVQELEDEWSESAEHVTEAFFSIYAAFSHIAHKNGRQLSEMIAADYVRGKELIPAKSAAHLGEWVRSVFGKFRSTALQETRSARAVAVKEAQKYILSNLSGELSVQSISDSLRMHPAYLSRLYKLETGENISDYITRQKLEKALQLLKFSPLKIYEIAIEIGYQNPNYFIKVFKKHFGLTPQEYRNANA